MPVLSLPRFYNSCKFPPSNSNSNSIHHHLLSPTNLAFYRSLPFKSQTISPLSSSSNRRRCPIRSPRKRVRCGKKKKKKVPKETRAMWEEEAEEEAAAAARHAVQLLRELPGISRRYLAINGDGDGGILPFLESIGLNHSSAPFIARYLSSETLPDLITKVRFLKDMLFSSKSHEELIGKNARCMMKHLSISIDDDFQRTLSFFEKLEAKHGGLNILGY